MAIPYRRATDAAAMPFPYTYRPPFKHEGQLKCPSFAAFGVSPTAQNVVHPTRTNIINMLLNPSREDTTGGLGGNLNVCAPEVAAPARSGPGRLAQRRNGILVDRSETSVGNGDLPEIKWTLRVSGVTAGGILANAGVQNDMRVTHFDGIDIAQMLNDYDMCRTQVRAQAQCNADTDTGAKNKALFEQAKRDIAVCRNAIARLSDASRPNINILVTFTKGRPSLPAAQQIDRGRDFGRALQDARNRLRKSSIQETVEACQAECNKIISCLGIVYNEKSKYCAPKFHAWSLSKCSGEDKFYERNHRVIRPSGAVMLSGQDDILLRDTDKTPPNMFVRIFRNIFGGPSDFPDKYSKAPPVPVNPADLKLPAKGKDRTVQYTNCVHTCHKDKCEGGWLNSVPSGEQWVVTREKDTKNGCCAFMASACDRCCEPNSSALTTETRVSTSSKAFSFELVVGVVGMAFLLTMIFLTWQCLTSTRGSTVEKLLDADFLEAEI